MSECQIVVALLLGVVAPTFLWALVLPYWLPFPPDPPPPPLWFAKTSSTELPTQDYSEE